MLAGIVSSLLVIYFIQPLLDIHGQFWFFILLLGMLLGIPFTFIVVGRRVAVAVAEVIALLDVSRGILTAASRYLTSLSPPPHDVPLALFTSPT